MSNMNDQKRIMKLEAAYDLLFFLQVFSGLFSGLYSQKNCGLFFLQQSPNWFLSATEKKEGKSLEEQKWRLIYCHNLYNKGQKKAKQVLQVSPMNRETHEKVCKVIETKVHFVILTHSLFGAFSFLFHFFIAYLTYFWLIGA